MGVLVHNDKGHMKNKTSHKHKKEPVMVDVAGDGPPKAREQRGWDALEHTGCWREDPSSREDEWLHPAHPRMKIAGVDNKCSSDNSYTDVHDRL